MTKILFWTRREIYGKGGGGGESFTETYKTSHATNGDEVHTPHEATPERLFRSF